MTAVKDIEIEARLLVPFLHFAEKVKALFEGNDLVDLAVEDLHVGFGNGIEVFAWRSVKKFFFVIAATVFNVRGVGRGLFPPTREVTDGGEGRDRSEGFGAEACHQKRHVRAAAETDEEDVFCIHIFVGTNQIKGVLDVLLGVKRAAGECTVWITDEIGAAEFGQEQMKTLFLGKGKQITDLIASIVTPCVKADDQRSRLIFFCPKEERGLIGAVQRGLDPNFFLHHKPFTTLSGRSRRR